jgi:hypothetical protein
MPVVVHGILNLHEGISVSQSAETSRRQDDAMTAVTAMHGSATTRSLLEGLATQFAGHERAVLPLLAGSTFAAVHDTAERAMTELQRITHESDVAFLGARGFVDGLIAQQDRLADLLNRQVAQGLDSLRIQGDMRFAIARMTNEFAISPRSESSTHLKALIESARRDPFARIADGIDSAMAVQLKSFIKSTEFVSAMTSQLSASLSTLTSDRRSTLGQISTSFEALNGAGERLMQAFTEEPLVLARFSPSLVMAPVIETYAAGQAIGPLIAKSLRPLPSDDLMEATLSGRAAGLPDQLRVLDPALPQMYAGALERIERRGPDWIRHALVSFRELMTHVLHKLAPDQRVIPWAQPRHYHNGKLTRRARVEFIVRSLHTPAMNEFLAADLTAALALIDLLNGETHRLTTELTSQHISVIRQRVEVLLTILLEASGD